MRLKNTLPPPNSLVVFEAVARHLNFTAASEELNVAQPAVTRQIRNLEANLKVNLFLRNNNKLQLTAEGEQFRRSVSESLTRIAVQAEHLRNSNTKNISIGSTFAFANLWLAPRLSALRHGLPETSLNLLIAEHYEEFDASLPDCSIRFGRGDWPGMQSKLLFAEKIVPMATPDFAAEHNLLDTKVWRNIALLDQPRDTRQLKWMTWKQWSEATSDISLEDCDVVEFEDYLYVLDAAISGRGVTLGIPELTHKYEKRGELIRVGPPVENKNTGYYLVYPEWFPKPEIMSTMHGIMTDI